MDLQEEVVVEDKYKPYSERSEESLKKLEELANQSIWRQNYHIQPKSGLLNDPNGFSYHNGKWHLFYQSFPYGTIHGLKSWQPMISDDLIHWKSEGEPILADTIFDSHGAYSGSALSVEDELRIFYTGNVRDAESNRLSYQLGAIVDEKQSVIKMEKPLINQQPVGYTAHFRDPHVFKYLNAYYLIIGAQTNQLAGEILYYKSFDLNDWDFQGVFNFTDKKMGYMIECPHLVGLNKTPILIFCPQGLDKTVLDYDNENPNSYLLGTQVDFESGNFESDNHLENLDDGFDVYATQAIDAPDGRTLSVSWIGISDNGYPVCDDGWTNCLSLVKELTVKNNKLYQYPVQEITKYKKLLAEKKLVVNGLKELFQPDKNNYELELNIPENSRGTLFINANKAKTRYLEINFDSFLGYVTVNRSKVGKHAIKENKAIRTSKLTANEKIKMNIFVDTSSVEIFFNNGEKVLSSLVFPEKEDTLIFIEMLNANIQSKLFIIC